MFANSCHSSHSKMNRPPVSFFQRGKLEGKYRIDFTQVLIPALATQPAFGGATTEME